MELTLYVTELNLTRFLLDISMPHKAKKRLTNLVLQT
jgi:hypothetical protein